jgi:hypothetical protein
MAIAISSKGKAAKFAAIASNSEALATRSMAIAVNLVW